MSEWVLVVGTDTMTVYFDPSTLRRDGNITRMWHLTDLKSASAAFDGKPYLSDKGQDEYDCKKNLSRTLAFSLHSKNMGKGETVYSESNPLKRGPVPWDRVEPSTAAELMWKIACKKQ